MEQLFCIPVQVAHHIAISDKLAAQKGAIFCRKSLRGCNFFAKVWGYAKTLTCWFDKIRKYMTNTDTFFSWVPVRRSVTGILKFVAHFWFESVLQCSNFLHWCATMFEFSALLYVYRHANLCSGLRTILSPQFIKKEFAILSIGTSEEEAPAASRFEPTPVRPETDAL